MLDSYAMRSGDRTWLTPITEEGLAELRLMLRRTATRQTSIACFRNDGRSRMKLLWIVGSKTNFNKVGVSPVATQARKHRGDLPEWVRVCGLTNDRMNYAAARTHKMPIGSGAIESAIRRVINLRVKSNATYWLRDNAETMIRVRAWLKAGRSQEFFTQTTYITPSLSL